MLMFWLYETKDFWTHAFMIVVFSAFAIGKGALMGGSALGLGALCFYGLGMSTDASTIMNNSM